MDKSESFSVEDFPCPLKSIATTRAFSLILLADNAKERLVQDECKYTMLEIEFIKLGRIILNSPRGKCKAQQQTYIPSEVRNKFEPTKFCQLQRR